MTAADRVLVFQLRMALASVAFAIVAGAFSVLHYIPEVSVMLESAGLGLTKLRPLHTAFASVWIYGAAVAVIYHYLHKQGGGLSSGDIKRFWFHTACWLTAGVGILVTLLAGIFSGREYVGFNESFSAILLLGWFAFAWTFLRRLAKGFWAQPIYIYFWTIGVLYFIYTFVEWHAYLLPSVGENPVRDLQLQWKSCGTLVGSFNFLVYGCLVYASERLSGDKTYGQSATAFGLFFVGCLNSFTNFAHHTYHLPGDHWVKWIAFVVSMLEGIILLHLIYGITQMLKNKQQDGEYSASTGYMVSAKWWTTIMLVGGIAISVPQFNSLIHGTHMVVGHAMGTELGIDTMILFGAVTYLLSDLYRSCPQALARLSNPAVRRQTRLLNWAMALLVTWLSVSGTVHGIYRYEGLPAPDWIGWAWFLFPICGFLVGGMLVMVLLRWFPLLFAVQERRATEPGMDSP
ncbi:MAG: cbb3-type cytochrome c oxidase subunit I, partial [Planctomycetota bacterium]